MGDHKRKPRPQIVPATETERIAWSVLNTERAKVAEEQAKAVKILQQCQQAGAELAEREDLLRDELLDRLDQEGTTTPEYAEVKYDQAAKSFYLRAGKAPEDPKPAEGPSPAPDKKPETAEAAPMEEMEAEPAEVK